MRWEKQFVGIALAVLVGAFNAPAQALTESFPGTLPIPDKAATRAARLAVPFVENAGQLEPGVRFRASLGHGAMFVMDDGSLVYAMRSGVAATERLARRPAPPKGESLRATRIASFIGSDPAMHRTDIRTFDAVALGEVFPGIDVKLAATARNVEKIFTVRPGADPSAIAMGFDGGARLRIDAGGALQVATSDGEIGFTPPIAFQEIDGARVPVHVAYALDARKNRYGFEVGRYNRTRPLIIDPLVQSTYLGGNDDEIIEGIAVHPVTGDVIVAGSTKSTNLPCTVAGGGCATAPQTAHASDGSPVKDDGFIARLSADLTQLKQVTYLGGNGIDEIKALAIHPLTGDVIVAGHTYSNNLPCTVVGGICADGARTAHAVDGGRDDGFVARLSADLTQLKQTTYLGGDGFDSFHAVTIHPISGEVIVGGYTTSSNFPGRETSPSQRNIEGGVSNFGDGILSRLSANLTQVLASAYYPGGGTESFRAVVVHPVLDQIFAAGISDSFFILCSGIGAAVSGCTGAQVTKAGGVDGFVVAFNAQLTRYHQATYFGGNGTDHIYAMAIAPGTGDILIGGLTDSNNLPCTSAGGVCKDGGQELPGGSFDGFVARLSSDLFTIRQATYIGGTSIEQVHALAVHPGTGEVFVAGENFFSNLPCTSVGGVCGIGAQSTHGNDFVNSDGFVARFNADLTVLRQATYLGGNGGDTAKAITFHPPSGDVLIAGWTRSTDFPCTTTATPGCGTGARSTHSHMDGSLYDGFVSRLTSDLTQFDTTPTPLNFAPVNNAPVLTPTTSAPVQITGITGTVPVYIDGEPSSAYCLSSAANCSCNVTGGFVSGFGNVTSGTYVCVRHQSAAFPNQITKSAFHVGGRAGVFRVSTGALLGGGGAGSGCSLDIDGNNAVDALTDGLMLIRAMFGLTGTSVTNNAVGGGMPSRTTWAQIRAFLNANCGVNFAP